jgi:hypothetical protein
MPFMKYRINNLRYNTKTGNLLINRAVLNYPWKDSELYFEADLYKSRTGEYFLCGKGGILSFFKGGEEKIIPLEKKEAQQICKEFMDPKAYHDEFGR